MSRTFRIDAYGLLVFVTAAVVACSAFGAHANEPAMAATSARRLDLKVERLWSENGLTHATVSIRNTATYDLAKVTVRCLAFGADRQMLDTEERSVVSPGEERLVPGGLKTTRIALRAGGGDVSSVSCEARAL